MNRRRTPFAAIRATLLALGLTAAAAVGAAEPVLEIAHGGQTRHYSRAELLANPALRTIEVPNDVAYKRPMLYRALPLSVLLPQLDTANSVQFVARDGFAATIPARLLQGGPNTRAWLAIEPQSPPWPALKLGVPSAGPFYLVWTGAENMGISPEQWPYQIIRIADSQPLTTRFPQLRPQGVAADRPEWRGLQAYTTHCAACHRLNGGGDAQLGPDLNQPFSPIEYFEEIYLRRLIRDPAAVRDWPQRHMPGFSAQVLPEPMLDDLLAYFRHMAARRLPTTPK